MRLASIDDGTPDGVLAVVDRAAERLLPLEGATLQRALEQWDRFEPRLRRLAARLEAGAEGVARERETLLSPLPRAYQWAEASSYHRHMERLRAARGLGLPPDHGRVPSVYQSGSDRFLRPDEEIVLGDEEWGLDCEATVATVVDGVPLGADAAEAARRVRLLVLTNDLTYRNLLAREYAAGVGFYQAKPARAYAPFAVTPDELGPLWRDGLLHARVEVWVNERQLGDLHCGSDCAFDFFQILEHMAMTRALAAGSIVGSGTVANVDPERGFGCIAERRALDIAAGRKPADRFLAAGDRVRIEAFDPDGRSIFGALDQAVVSPAR